MRIQELTPVAAILVELGERLALLRRSQGLTQAELAEAAGLGVATLRRLEDGRDGQLGSWLKLLKALGQDGAIDGLLPESRNSPMDEVLGSGRRRSESKGFRWGDEGG